ncbi:glycosyltransferase family 2 protein [Lactobacillaceae bacterium 24-114]
MEKISVIVPIYNNEEHLAICIQSILQQSYSNLDIILVNNGSTDSSLAIITHYAAQDRRIRIINQEHRNIGNAKNVGLSMATGDFICFVHPNDSLGPDNIKNLVESQRKFNSDIACSTYYKLDNNGNFYFYINNDDPTQEALEGVFSPQEWIHRENNVSVNMTDLFIQDFNKLIRRSLFKDVMFPDINQCEDNFTIWKLYLLADRISYINVGDYCYRIINTKESNHQIFQRNLYELKSLEERLAIYELIDFDYSFLENKYKNQLVALRDAALESGNYHYYKDCSFKLDMIKKYGKTTFND